MRLNGGCIRTDVEAGAARSTARGGRDCHHGRDGDGERKRASWRVRRVLVPNAVGRKCSGRWVERVGGGRGILCRRHLRAAGWSADRGAARQDAAYGKR